jgi:hypothetical protein
MSHVVHGTARFAILTPESEPVAYIARLCDRSVREPEMHQWADVTCEACLGERDAMMARAGSDHFGRADGSLGDPWVKAGTGEPVHSAGEPVGDPAEFWNVKPGEEPEPKG